MKGLFEWEREELVEAEPPSVPPNHTNALILNAFLRRQAVYANLEDTIALQLARIYAGAIKEATARLSAAAARGLGPEAFSQQLRGRFLGEMREVIRSMQGEVDRDLGRALRELNRVELKTGVEVLEHAIPDDVLAHISVVRPSGESLVASRQEVLGRSLGRWGRKASGHLLDELAATIARGLDQGDDMAQMIRRTADVFDVSLRAAQGTARTAVLTVSNEAQASLYEANQDVLKGVQYQATFDKRTCPVCAAMDGQVFLFGDGSYDKRPRLPQHPLCRCVYIALTKSWAELGAKGIRDISPGSRASMNGQVPGRTTMTSWLKSEPKSVPLAILGRTRTELFLSGKMELKGFVNDRTGRPFRLDELESQLGRALNFFSR